VADEERREEIVWEGEAAHHLSKWDVTAFVHFREELTRTGAVTGQVEAIQSVGNRDARLSAQRQLIPLCRSTTRPITSKSLPPQHLGEEQIWRLDAEDVE
jgi:hypothetical protein